MLRDPRSTEASTLSRASPTGEDALRPRWWLGVTEMRAMRLQGPQRLQVHEPVSRAPTRTRPHRLDSVMENLSSRWQREWNAKRDGCTTACCGHSRDVRRQANLKAIYWLQTFTYTYTPLRVTSLCTFKRHALLVSLPDTRRIPTLPAAARTSSSVAIRAPFPRGQPRGLSKRIRDAQPSYRPRRHARALANPRASRAHRLSSSHCPARAARHPLSTSCA